MRQPLESRYAGVPALLAICAVVAAALTTVGNAMGVAASAPAETGVTAARVEARSADLVAVGMVHGDRMTIRLSQVIDNAPLADASITVVLRGVVHATTAQTDGSYLLESQDLTLPGAAAVEFQVARAAMRQSLKGTLQVAAGTAQSEDKNTARQLWWWVLNFAVCIGFLWLFSRRRKAAQKKVSD